MTTSFPSRVRTANEVPSACSSMPSTSVICLLSGGPGRQRITDLYPVPHALATPVLLAISRAACTARKRTVLRLHERVSLTRGRHMVLDVGWRGAESMCGIVGIRLKNPDLYPALGQLVAEMLDPLALRGPDSTGVAIYCHDAPDGAIKYSLCAPADDYDWPAFVAALE